MLINYYCPDFFHGEEIYDKLLMLKKEQPQIFYDYVNIKKIFGSVPNMIWNGGGYDFGPMLLKNDLEELRNRYEEKGIPLQLTCTNPSLESTDVYDRYCNMVLSVFENGINEVLVSSPYLEEYIRKNFPKYKIDKSIIASEFDYDINNALYKYNNVVLPRRYAKDFNYLNNEILEKNRGRVEILCNDPCPINCKFLYQHYKEYGKVQLYEKCPDEKGIECEMPFRKEFFWNQDSSQKITYQEIVDKYLQLGYTEFKLSGRSDYAKMAYLISTYFIKPEFQTRVMLFFLQ